MRIGKITELIEEGDMDAWDLADKIQWEVYILQKVQSVYFNDVSVLNDTEEEELEERLLMLEIVGNEILEHMEEIDEGLSTLINMIRALQKNRK